MWGFAAARLVATVSIGIVVGFAAGRPWLGLAVALAVHAAWQLTNLYRLDHWLRHRSLADPPVLHGLWDEVVTQVVRLHRRKRHHKQRLATVLRELRESTAALPDGVVALTARGEIAWFNRMAGQLLHLQGRRDIGLRIDNLLRQPEFARHLEAGGGMAPLVLQVGDAPEAWLSLHVLPYGEGQRMLLIRDVTRQTRLETMRKDFVANASHELRSPLTVIAGYLEAFASDPDLEVSLGPPLAEMRRQAERMAAIIGDLLVLSRLEAKDGSVEGEPVDVVAMLGLLRKDILARPQRPASVELVVETHDRLRGDELELHSAFANLVDNAAKYTPAGGRVVMRWWSDAQGAHFSVADTGPGIPANAIPRLTERFYRVDPGRSRATGGSGLGLAIVKHVLQRHAATLEVESAEGRGSTFSCHFPRERVLAAVGRPWDMIGNHGND
ncbi:MAG: phosphate regulon sensor histidine kinase PhoR [Steroidobacteraceae bacterium]